MMLGFICANRDCSNNFALTAIPPAHASRFQGHITLENCPVCRATGATYPRIKKDDGSLDDPGASDSVREAVEMASRMRKAPTVSQLPPQLLEALAKQRRK